MKTLFTWLQNTEGATVIEYGFITAGVALAIMAAVFLIGGDIATIFNTINQHIETATATL